MMQKHIRLYFITTLLLLSGTLMFGLVASWAYLYPENYNKFLPFYQLRPFHVSAALFWIISAATCGILLYKKEVFSGVKNNILLEQLFIYTWIGTIATVFVCYGLKKFGGREYWEFPPVLGLPLLVSWLLLMGAYFIPLIKTKGVKPMYMWMWSTGIFFFLVTFIEQNLWLVPWFRQSYLRELTIQWKANGATVGAWNQMIYGTSLYLMVKISGDEKKAQGKIVFFFYMLGLTNLMFNWGHHVYNVPGASWIRDTSYIISMTEWVFLIKMIQGFRSTLEEGRRLKHLITYRFIIASEFWVFANLLLTLAMSVPAINRYTHGTHITVAHSMGATIGINTMILLASFTYILNIDQKSDRLRKTIRANFWLCQISLFAFWIALIAAGIIKAYGATELNLASFQEIMKPVMPALKAFSIAGIGVVISLVTISVIYIKQAIGNTTT